MLNTLEPTDDRWVRKTWELIRVQRVASNRTGTGGGRGYYLLMSQLGAARVRDFGVPEANCLQVGQPL